MMVLVTLSFTSAGSTIQGVGAESESQEELWEGGQDGKRRFWGVIGDNHKSQSMEMGWTHRVPGRKEVCVSPLTNTCYLLHWMGVSSQPLEACRSFPPLQGEGRAGSCPSSSPKLASTPRAGSSRGCAGSRDPALLKLLNFVSHLLHLLLFAIIKTFCSQILYFIPKWF